MPKKKTKTQKANIYTIKTLIEFFEERTPSSEEIQKAIAGLKKLQSHATLTPWNIQDYLKTPEDIANYLESVLEENDAEYTIIAVKDAIAALRNLKKEMKQIGSFENILSKELPPILEVHPNLIKWHEALEKERTRKIDRICLRAILGDSTLFTGNK